MRKFLLSLSMLSVLSALQAQGIAIDPRTGQPFQPQYTPSVGEQYTNPVNPDDCYKNASYGGLPPEMMNERNMYYQQQPHINGQQQIIR